MSASVPLSSFPSSSSTSAVSSTSISQQSKRHSVSVFSSSTRSGTRPLHLLDLANSSTSSSFTSSLASATPYENELYPPSPVSAYSPLHNPPLSSPTSRPNTLKGSRRQSSISYFSANHDKEKEARRASSPLHGSCGAGPSRNGTLDPGNRASTGSTVLSPTGIEREKERPPLILAEKHAELLHFIAQKESKCLELRSQLAVHEAELLQLKRKWERIVNRGFERENSSPSPNSAHISSSPDFQGALMSITSPTIALEGIKEGVQGMSRFLTAGLSLSGPVPTSAGEPSPKPVSASSRSAVRPGTPSRFTASPSPLSPSPLSASTTSLVSSTDSQRFSPPRTIPRHIAQASNSSSSTTGTTNTTRSTSTTATNAHRLSQCSSVTSAEDNEGKYDVTDEGIAQDEELKRQGSPQELIMSDTGATPTVSPNPAFHKQKEKRLKRRDDNRNHDQNDLDWTITGGGGGDMEADADPWAMAGKETGDDAWDAWGDGELVNEFSGVDDRTPTKKRVRNGNATGIIKLKDPPPSLSLKTRAMTSLNTGLSAPSHSSSKAKQQHSTFSIPPTSMVMTSVPASSIPGLGAASASIAGLSALASPQVSAWVGSMGKKLGELQKGSNALTKSQKRASIMFSDMSQTIASALGSTTPATPSLHPSSKTSPTASPSLTSQFANSPTFASNTHRPTHSPPFSSSLSRSLQKSKGAEQMAGVSKSPTSLLDDDDDDNLSLMTKSVSSASMSVMTPDVRSISNVNNNTMSDSLDAKGFGLKNTPGEVTVPEEEEEWNW